MGWRHPITILTIGIVVVLSITSSADAQFGFFSRRECHEDQYQCHSGTCILRSQLCDRVTDCPNGDDESNCHTECVEGEHQCRDGFRCINDDQVCDGEIDCPSGDDEEDCDSDTFEADADNKCEANEFECEDTMCIPKKLVCDGHSDCSYGEDEANCPEAPIQCRPDEFECANHYCISATSRCDGITECFDGSDEANCTSCQVDTFHCHSGECLQGKFRCDTRVDCLDGSDEFGCERCRPSEFECGDGTCLSQEKRCDGVPQCTDGTDELECEYDHRDLTEEDCSYDEFFCDDQCHPRYQLCNGHPDCLDRRDEENCSHIYPSTTAPSYYNRCPEYTCPSGKCFRKSERCDSIPDCEDGFDERDCCRPDQFKCNDNTCVDRSAQCDGRQDCPDGSDESNCAHTGVPSRCQSYQWPCSNGQCINAYARCDGRTDCADSSDEIGCPIRDPDDQEKKSCGPNTFRCENGPCIPNELRCDGHVDCPFDISDELDCAIINNEITPSKPPSDPQLNLKTYPSNQIIKESREVVFRCRDEGPSRARVKWSRPGGRPLPPGFSDKNGRLEIPNIRIEDAGEYVCEAVGYPSFTPGQRVTVHLTVEKYNPLLEIPQQACGYHEATCMNGECISKTSICDGIPHCSDGSDEHSCSYGRKCNPNQFNCKNGKCVDRTWRCDGENDCGDNSDEESCDPAPSSSPCRYDEFQCKSGHCIPKTFHCDRTNDCIDGSDEHGCMSPVVIQPPPPRVTLQLGGVLNITCRATGVPTPIIVWRRNWGHVPDKCSSTTSGGFGSLYCPDMQHQDSGAYSCEVINTVGTIFVVPDTIVIIEAGEDVCPAGYFNVEAVRSDQCINCFCFGVATECKSADLFVYHLPPPVTSRKVVLVNIPPYGDMRITDYSGSELINLGHGIQFRASNVPYSAQEVPYLDLPPEYHGNQLKSYGGSLKYEAQYIGRGRPITAPDVILVGNGYTLTYRHPQEMEPNIRNPVKAQFVPGAWLKPDGRQATREEIMMTLAGVENVLIRLQYIDATERQVEITYIIMDSAVADDKGLGSASLVEQCSCPPGYSGFSCESCAPGFVRQRGAPWLGRCTPEPPPTCPSGTYGDPSRNIPCRPCPCPLTNIENNFARECSLGPNNDAICYCLPGYTGKRCEQCDQGYEGNPLMPGGSCRPISHPRCDPLGTEEILPDGSCQCKPSVVGTYCDTCAPNSFLPNNFSSTGCIECFCMGVTKQCSSSSWYRDTIHSGFGGGRAPHGFRVIADYETSSESDVRIQEANNEIQLQARAGDDVLYWSLPEKFLGDKVTSYGGTLNYTIRYNPLPGGLMSKNVAPDVVIKSANDLVILHYRRSLVSPSVTQSYSIPIIENAWQRTDGITVNREHLLMALADIEHIFIKATYTTVTQDAALSHVSLDTAIQTNIGSARAVEVEQCACPPGYLGLSCEDCAPGYKRSDEEGLYLGICEPCDCNGHSSECDPETGQCHNCRDNTEGDRCEHCAPGYEGNATHGAPLACRPSGSYPSTTCENCNPNGTVDCHGNQCICKANVIESTCNRCRPGTFNLEASNRDGCSECFCSGVTTSCTSGTFSRIEVPVDFFTDDFTLNNYDGNVLIDTGTEKSIEDSQIAYMRPLYSTHFWSLPPRFLGNQVKSYGGNLQFTLRTGGDPQSFVPDQDVILLGNNKKLIWTRPQYLQDRETISVKLHESEGWLLEDGRPAERRDILTVLSNLNHILIRANPQGSSAPFSQLRDVTMETAINAGGLGTTTDIEQCYCPREYDGSSCESCAPLHYRNVTQRVGDFGACIRCPCNEGYTESCSMDYRGRVECYCREGYGGDNCERPMSERPIITPPPIPTPNPVTISVTVSTPEILIKDVGQSVTLECTGEVIATRQPITVFWYRLNNNLPETAILEGGRLHISNLQVHDSGVYVCQARRDHELAEKKVSVTVEHGGGTPSNVTRPRVVLEPPYLEIEEYRPAEAYCTATGYPEPYVSWTRIDGRPLSPYIVTDQQLIRFTSARKSDEGSYRCTAQNNYGVEYGTLEVYIISSSPTTSPPQPPFVSHDIYISPPAYNGQPGDLVQLACNVGERADIRWLKDNQDVYPGRNIEVRDNVLIITSAMPSDTGIYTCNAYVPQAQTTHSATAYVTIEGRTGGGGDVGGGEAPPRIKPLQNQHVIVQGQDFSITCEATGGSYPTIKWTKLHEPLDSNVQQTGGTLKITNAQPKNRGVYLCIAETPAGTDQTDISVDVEPRERPMIEIRPRAPQYVRLGEGVMLSCQPIGGIPTPKITWQRTDRRPISSRARTEYYSLIFNEIRPEDAGEYECHAENVAGHVSATAVIHVSEPPNITLYPPNETVELTEGDELKIKCHASGNPSPSVRWADDRSREIQRLAPQGVYGLEQPVTNEAFLEIYRITQADSKLYTCSANNDAGSDTKYVYVQVKPRRGDTGISDVDYPTPQTPYPRNVYTADIGDNSTLSCHVEGVARNRTRWERIDGKPLPRGSYYHNNDLIIPVISQDALGVYECLLLDNGKLIPLITAELILIPIPRITFSPPMPMTVRPGENVEILCQVSGEQPIHMQWYAENQRPLPPSVRVEGQYLKFHAITPDDAGRYYCLASNRHGNVTKVAEVLVNRERVSPPSTATSHEVYEGQGVSLDCSIPYGAGADAQYRWRKEGGPMPIYVNYDRNRLILTSVKRDDEGRYICEVMQSNGILSVNHVDLYVKPITEMNPGVTFPSLASHPTRTDRIVGESVEVDCRSTSGEDVDVIWQRADGKGFPPHIRQFGSKLIIRNVQLSDTGEYICRCRTDKEFFHSATFELDILDESRESKRPKIEHVEIGKTVKLTCDADKFPATFKWTRPFGQIQSGKDTTTNELRLDNVQAKDAGTYVCTVTHEGHSRETPIILIVTGAIPHFLQAPTSYITFPPLHNPDASRFSMEITFKPERSNGKNGLLLYVGERNPTTNFFSLSLNDGHPEARYSIANVSRIVRSERPISMGDWHTMRIFRNRRDALMHVDDQAPVAFPDDSQQFKKTQEFSGNLYIGGYPRIEELSPDVAEHKNGFVGCVSFAVVQDKIIEINEDAIRKEGVTSCEPCAEEPCKNDGVCLESQTEMGYTCICQRGYTGRHCTIRGNACTPGVCGVGRCENNELGIECFCPLNKTGDRCQYIEHLDEASLSFKDGSYAAYKTPKNAKVNITFHIRPNNLKDSVVMYIAESKLVNGDFVAVVIKDQHVELIVNYGGRVQPFTIRSHSPIQANKWTEIHLARKTGESILRVGDEPEVRGKPPGTARFLNLKTNLYIGGYDKRIHVHENLNATGGFDGCISNLRVNYENYNLIADILDAANVQNCRDSNEVAPPPIRVKPTGPIDPCSTEPCRHGGTCISGSNGQFQCLCPFLHAGETCQHDVYLSTNAHFSRNSYLELDNSTLANADDPENSFFVMVFSTRDPDGLLLWQGQEKDEPLSSHHDYISAALVDGQVELAFRIDGRNISLRTNEPFGTFNNGKPHIIVAKRSGYDATLETDKKVIYTQEDSILPPSRLTLNLPGPVFLGGAPDVYQFTGRRYKKGFNGCIHILENIDGAVNLSQRAKSAVNVEECSKDELNTESPLS